MLALFAPSTNSFLAGLGAKPKTAPVPMYPGAGSASEVGSTGLPGDIGFDSLVRRCLLNHTHHTVQMFLSSHSYTSHHIRSYLSLNPHSQYRVHMSVASSYSSRT